MNDFKFVPTRSGRVFARSDIQLTPRIILSDESGPGRSRTTFLSRKLSQFVLALASFWNAVIRSLPTRDAISLVTGSRAFIHSARSAGVNS